MREMEEGFEEDKRTDRKRGFEKQQIVKTGKRREGGT
jgi:hypothetical protein